MTFLLCHWFSFLLFNMETHELQRGYLINQNTVISEAFTEVLL